jgi:Tfp pilus assembly protein PilO
VTQAREKKSTPSLTASPRLLLYLLTILGLVLGGYLSYGAYASYTEVRGEVNSLREEADRLRGQAAIVARLREEVARLEAAFAAIRWPEAPEAGGAVWLAGELAKRGWGVKNLSVGKAEEGGGLTRTPVTVSVEGVPYEDFIRGIEAVKERRVRLRGLKLSADAKGNLTGEVVFEFLRPAQPSPAPTGEGATP